MQTLDSDDIARWRKAAGQLRNRLQIDYRNHSILCHPWARAAHCMVQGWRNVVSQGRLGYVPEPRMRIATWNEAAQSMRHLLNTRRRQRLLDDTTWRFWAGHLPRVELRSIRKSQRPTCPLAVR